MVEWFWAEPWNIQFDHNACHDVKNNYYIKLKVTLQFMLSFSIRTVQRPVYRIDFGNSEYTSYRCVNNEHVFTVEQGTRFYLKLHLTANPMPTNIKLYGNGEELQRSPTGTIYADVDYFRIDRVDQSYPGSYRLSSRNFMGEGSISFVLKVQGKHIKKHLTLNKPQSLTVDAT